MRAILLAMAVLALAAGFTPVAEASHGEGCTGDPDVVAVCKYHHGTWDCYRIWTLGTVEPWNDFCVA